MGREWSISPQHTLVWQRERAPKTHVDADSDFDPIDKLNQEPSVNLLVKFEAIPLQRAF
jgi:hypothetical protein